MKHNDYIPIIGLEVHVELKTKSKMFCRCSAEYFGKEPNTHCCPVCLGLPGALPVPNKRAIEWCVMIGLALNCKIPLLSKFDRKNYFYPDLPKGYQISQYDEPFAVNGFVNTISKIRNPKSETNSKRIRIRRVHMEEDTGKLIHATVNGEKVSLIDFNRSGVPLVEIVTEPDFESTSEVVEYLKKLQQIVRYLEVSDADMEKGEMRLEPNISLKNVILASKARYRLAPGKARPESPSKVRDAGQASMTDTLPSYKVEVKNINSFRFVEKAINYEIERQNQILESGKTPIQETRGWDEEKQITVSQRIKEEAMDYRYFPEPDIPPIHWTQYQISNLKSQIPELPDQKSLRFQKDYGLSQYQAQILTAEKTKANYFEEAVKVNHELGNMNQEYTNTKTIANWIINKKVNTNLILPAHLIQNILTSAQTTTINTKELEKIVREMLEKNPKAVEDYKKGKTAVIGFLIGNVKQMIKKPLDTNQIKDVIEKLIKTY